MPRAAGLEFGGVAGEQVARRREDYTASRGEFRETPRPRELSERMNMVYIDGGTCER